MMKKIILLFLLINVNLVAYNQIIKGTILDNETKKPIYSAAVYFNGTSVGTLSDEDGDFKLDILTFSSMPLSISAIGYYSVTLDEFSDSMPNIVYMNPKLFELNEVIVNDKSHTSERNENLTTFRDVFLGTSWNAENCEITNEDDIRFLYSSDKDTLKAFTIKPILIDNRALGYKITYYLDKFEYSKPDRIFLFTGKIFFSEDLTATGRKKKHFEKKREDAYFGSRMNFFRNLWFDDLDSAGYQVKNSANVTLDYKDIVSQKDRETKFLKYHGDLGISFGTHKPPSSIIFLKDSVLFYPNGYFDPKGITWRGGMAEQRIADLLPYEYSTSESSASSFPISPKIKMAGILNQIEKNIPSDQLYMHLDRNLYHPGDTIRFQAYIRDRKSGIMGSESISLHSLLLNQAHRTIDSARFRIVNCTASGWLKIPETIPPGNFSVTAFTSMMMNYDPEFVFSVPIRIDEQKNARLEMAQIADKSSSLSYQTSTIHPFIDLRFLPEGGTLIYAIPQRMAFNAVTSSGRTLKVNGEIRNQRGEKVADFSSGEFGPGLVEFTPLQGDTYFASLKGEEFSGMKWPLPIPDSSGISMRVNNNEGIINVLLEGRGVESKAYILAITMNNSLVFSGDLRLDSLFRLSVKTEELPAGTAYITLYDNELNPVVERLIFVNDHKKMNIEISSSSSAVNSGDETELILNTTDSKGENISSVISIAVIDSVSGFCNKLAFPDISSTFLFDRNFYNNLPPGIKVHGLNNIDKKSIDLLLMTFGWRRFSLKKNCSIDPEKKLLDYDYLKISNLEHGRKGKLKIQILTLEDANVLIFPVDKDKEAFIQFNSLNDSVRRVRILADNRSTKDLISAKIEFPENRSFTDRAKQAHNEAFYDINTPILEFNSTSATSIPIPNMKEFNFPSDSVINIEEVIIRPKRGPAPPPVYINKYEKLYKSGRIRTLTTKDFSVWPSFEYILQLFNPYKLDVENKVVYLRPSRTFDTTAALFVLDDIPIGNSYEAIDVLPNSEIASVTVLKGTQGFTFYGGAAIGGVVFVTTKTSMEDDQHKKNDDLMRSIRLFRTEIEYYIPTKEETDSIPGLQYRPTVLWMNDVFIDGKEPVKIRYPNNMTKGTAMVLVNGVSFTNNVGSKIYKYKSK